MATGRIGVTPNLGIRWSKVPTGGTTSLSGNDDNSVPLAYSAGYEAVYRNGVLLSRGNDYTATNGTSITLTNATITGDLIEVFANQTVALTDTYSQSAANAKFINNTLTTTTGDIIYASAANTPARLGIGSTSQVLTVSGGVPVWGSASSSYSGVQLYKTADQTISDSTNTTMNWASEDIDVGGYHDNVTNNSRITIPSGKGGYYFVYTIAAWASNSSGKRIARFLKNGSAYRDGSNPFTLVNVGGGNSSETTQYLGLVMSLAAGDYVEVQVWQNSGGNLSTFYSSLFGAYLIGA
jgi:hypothetical protein